MLCFSNIVAKISSPLASQAEQHLKVVDKSFTCEDFRPSFFLPALGISLSPCLPQVSGAHLLCPFHQTCAIFAAAHIFGSEADAPRAPAAEALPSCIFAARQLCACGPEPPMSPFPSFPKHFFQGTKLQRTPFQLSAAQYTLIYVWIRLVCRKPLYVRRPSEVQHPKCILSLGAL